MTSIEEDPKKESWDELENRLIKNFLELSNPEITAPMIPMLTKESMIRKLMMMVTQWCDTYVETMNPISSGEYIWRHKELHCEEKPELEQLANDLDSTQKSFKIMSVLCGVQPNSEPLGFSPNEHVLSLTQIITPLVLALALDGFRPNTKANLYHICAFITFLVRCQTEKVLQSIITNKRAMKTSFNLMVDYIDDPIVSTTLLSLLCPVSSKAMDFTNGWFRVPIDTRHQYFNALANIGILDCIAKRIRSESSSPQLKAAACELLRGCIEKFAAIDGGNRILRGLAESPEILKGLIDGACVEKDLKLPKMTQEKPNITKGTPSKGKKKQGGKKKGTKKKKAQTNNKKNHDVEEDDTEEVEEGDDQQEDMPDIANLSLNEDGPSHEYAIDQLAALDTLQSIFDLSTRSAVQSLEPQEYRSFSDSQVNQITCQLHEVSDQIHDILDTNFDHICKTLVAQLLIKKISNIKHTSYTVPIPFSSFRLELVKLTVTCVVHKPSKFINKVPLQLWDSFAQWFIDYPNNNLYHLQFVKIFRAMVQTDIVKRQTLTKVLDRILPYLLETVVSSSTSNNSGCVLQCCNILRLQSAALGPDHPLNEYLANHEEWNKCVPVLEDITKKMLEPWKPSPAALFHKSHDQPGIITPKQTQLIEKLILPKQIENADIELGSAFADDLGFINITKFDPHAQAQDIHHAHVNVRSKKNSKRR